MGADRRWRSDDPVALGPRRIGGQIDDSEYEAPRQAGIEYLTQVVLGPRRGRVAGDDVKRESILIIRQFCRR